MERIGFIGLGAMCSSSFMLLLEKLSNLQGKRP
jgi:hypothetical protein